jgi:hypothetical protein
VFEIAPRPWPALAAYILGNVGRVFSSRAAAALVAGVLAGAPAAGVACAMLCAGTAAHSVHDGAAGSRDQAMHGHAHAGHGTGLTVASDEAHAAGGRLLSGPQAERCGDPRPARRPGLSPTGRDAGSMRLMWTGSRMHGPALAVERVEIGLDGRSAAASGPPIPSLVPLRI